MNLITRILRLEAACPFLPPLTPAIEAALKTLRNVRSAFDKLGIPYDRDRLARMALEFRRDENSAAAYVRHFIDIVQKHGGRFERNESGITRIRVLEKPEASTP